MRDHQVVETKHRILAIYDHFTLGAAKKLESVMLAGNGRTAPGMLASRWTQLRQSRAQAPAVFVKPSAFPRVRTCPQQPEVHGPAGIGQTVLTRQHDVGIRGHCG